MLETGRDWAPKRIHSNVFLHIARLNMSLAAPGSMTGTSLCIQEQYTRP